ncbi:hypothetical protein [Flavobacterium sp. W21_SRS_FM6]|uniref:hypothetical protein n=1 Tax=Flavobacterium sp. W21_SRS_FM6 TaxID=3240268 RepID=UPI003F906A05
MIKFWFLLVAVLAGLIGCSSDLKEETSTLKLPSESVESPLVLAKQGVQQTIDLRANDARQFQDITLQLLSIEDSRCPTGVTCIWAGQLIVKIKLSDLHGNIEEIELIRKREPETVSALGLSLLLLGVEPHPKKDKIIEFSNQVARIQITKN